MTVYKSPYLRGSAGALRLTRSLSPITIKLGMQPNTPVQSSCCNFCHGRFYQATKTRNKRGDHGLSNKPSDACNRAITDATVPIRGGFSKNWYSNPITVIGIDQATLGPIQGTRHVNWPSRDAPSSGTKHNGHRFTPRPHQS